MTKPKASQITIPDWHFSCTNCGECCRRWHVALSPQEIDRLSKLEWSPNDDIPATITTDINGYPYIAHRDDGSCIYHDRDRNMCKIHDRFGFEAKPRGCRVYPFNIATTFENEFSVTARFDCPAVRQNYGKRLDRAMRSIRGYIEEMGLAGGFDRFVRDDLSESVIRRIVRGFFNLYFRRDDIDTITQMTGAVVTAHRLEELDADFLNKIDIEDILPSFFDRSIANLQGTRKRRLNWVERFRFLNVWISYLRRDEDMIGKSFRSRIDRTRTLWNLYFRTGNLHEIGVEHPDAELPLSLLFTTPVANLSEIDWSLYLDLVRLRLQSFQFFGPTYYDLSFFIGMKSLYFSFPLVAAAAKWSALTRYRDMCCILPEDIDYAVNVIDHNLGRSALLSTGFFTTMVRQMTDYEAYFRLVHGILM